MGAREIMAREEAAMKARAAGWLKEIMWMARPKTAMDSHMAQEVMETTRKRSMS
jgi:hypothetical protein